MVTTDTDVTLAAKVAFLRQPSSYPETVYRVEAIETHMSWVFLTQKYAWKLKKPVHQDVLDFSTLAARQFYCEEEVRLNRRLAPDVYLGTSALTLDVAGHLQLDGPGRSVDWLVRMRRLPLQIMLDHVILNGTASRSDMMRIAGRLADFYRHCAAVSMTAPDYRARFAHRIDADVAELGSPLFALPMELLAAICAAQQAFLRQQPGLFDQRIAAGKVIEGHGDLRPEHVCMSIPLAVIDCLEFSYDLRVTDPADEVGFLALECDRLGCPDAGSLLVQYYREFSGDDPDAGLLHFYQSRRAMARATLAIRHLNEEQFRYSPQWRTRTGHYLQLAQHHAAFLGP